MWYVILAVVFVCIQVFILRKWKNEIIKKSRNQMARDVLNSLHYKRGVQNTELRSYISKSSLDLTLKAIECCDGTKRKDSSLKEIFDYEKESKKQD